MRYRGTMTYAFVVLFCLAWAYMFIRNIDVYRERKRVLAAIDEHAEADINAGRPWRWRFDAYDETTYAKMLWHVGRSPWSFFEDHPCTKA